MEDMLRRPLKVGDRVARAYRYSNDARMDIRTVMRVADNCVYLNDSHVPTYRTDRLLIIPGDYPQT